MREFPFSTVSTLVAPDSTRFSVSDTLTNIVNSGELVPNEKYPEGLFWGGIDKNFTPCHPAVIKYDITEDSKKLVITDYFSTQETDGNAHQNRQFSYAWITGVENVYKTFRWCFGEDVWNGIKSEWSNNTSLGYFCTDIPLNKWGWGGVVQYFDSTVSNAQIAETSIANARNLEEKYKIVGFRPQGRVYLSGTTARTIGGTDTTPCNAIFGDFKTDIYSEFNARYGRIVKGFTGDTTKFLKPHTSIGWSNRNNTTPYNLTDTHTIFFNGFNGNAEIDITDLYNLPYSGGGTGSLPYRADDKYFIAWNRISGSVPVTSSLRIDVYRVYKNVDELLSVIMSWGVPLIDTSVAGRTFNIDSADLYLPVLDDKNVYHGEFTHGTENLNNTYRNKTDFNDTDYIPPEPEPIIPEKEIDGDSVNLGFAHLGLIGQSCSHFAVINNYSVGLLKDELAQADPTFWDAISIAGDKDSGSIKNYILSCRCYPFNVSNKTMGNVVNNNKLNFGFRDAKIDLINDSLTNCTCSIDLGTVTTGFLTGTKSFWDFEPYTIAEIFLPFSGKIQLPAYSVIGKTLHCHCIVDLTTGQGTYYVNSVIDGIETQILQKSAQIGIDISVSGNDLTKQAENMVSGMFSAFRAVSGTVSDAVNKNVVGVVNDTVNLAETGINMSGSMRDIPSVITQGGGFNNSGIGRPYLYVKRPKITIPENYSHIFGNACLASGTLGSFSGYTVCKNPDLTGITATETEKNMIYNLLADGVYI